MGRKLRLGLEMGRKLRLRWEGKLRLGNGKET